MDFNADLSLIVFLFGSVAAKTNDDVYVNIKMIVGLTSVQKYSVTTNC